MQTTLGKKLNKLVALILIAVLTLADIMAIGVNFTSLALDMIATTNNNVEFEAYFKNENGEKLKEHEFDLNAEKINMYVDISILHEGYFNGKISLQDSNLKIVGITENSYVQGFEEEEVNLNQIRNGENVTIEMQVKPKTSDSINPDMLKQETKVNLEGKYVSSKGEETVKGTTSVIAKLVTPKDTKAKIEAEVLTNKIYEIDGINKRVLQVLVNSQIENNVYPVLKTNLTLTIPSGAESIDAIARGTDATNSKIEFRESNYKNDLGEGKLEITLENKKDENGNISFKQNAKDKLVVTCVYPEDKTFKDIKELENTLGENEEIREEDKKEAQIQVSQEITTYDEKVLNANTSVNLETEKDGIINYELTQDESEFYKGKIYSGEERDYNTNVIANVNSTKVERNIIVTLDNTNYIQEENKRASKISYKDITINKNNITKLLGEEGYIIVTDENNTVIANITKETIANETISIENENITIKIPENTYKLKIESSKAVKTGKIEFKITKSIVEKEYKRDEIKLFTGIENKITSNEETISKNIELKETATEASLELNTDTLKVGENEGVLITATLLSNTESRDLYKNPIIKILFPERATNVNPKYQLLYNKDNDSELEIASAVQGTENGRTVLTITLNGEQNKYPGSAIEGITVLVKADITISEQESPVKDSIKMQYTNEKAISYGISDTNEELTIGERTKDLEIKNTRTLRRKNVRTLSATQNLDNGSKLEITLIPETQEALKKGCSYSYYINIKNISDESIQNIEVEVYFNDVFENNSYTINVEKLESGENKQLIRENTVITEEITEERGIVEVTSVTANKNEISYTSQALEQDIEKNNIQADIKVLFPTERTTFYNEEMFSYKITIENKGNYDINNLKVTDIFNKNLEIQNVIINEQDTDYLVLNSDEENYMTLDIETKLNKDETIEIYIIVIVKAENINTLTEIKNKAEIYSYSTYIGKTEEKKINIISSKDLVKDDENNVNPEEKDNSNKENTSTQEDKENNNEDNSKKDEDKDTKDEEESNKENENNSFKVSGQAWVEEKETGDKRNSIESLSGINVYLIDVNTSNIVTDKENNKIVTKTDSDGKYSLTDIEKGRYIVAFEYDTNNYSITEYHKQGVDGSSNSDAVQKKVIIEGKEHNLAVTDILNIESDVSNIDLGLVKLKRFDLELTKTVNKITVTNSKETKEYNFDNSTLAKIEIPAKYLEGSTVKIEYSINVKNNGDIAGYAKKIVDYLPSELDFEEQINTGWKKEGDYIYNNSLENENIKAGETKEIKLILTKTMTESNTGLISNIAEIAEEYNALEIADTNSTPSNRKNGENDMGQADVIIGIKTGKFLRYTLLIISLFIICGISIELVKIKK